jgi:predicted phosphodiesterase
MLSLRTRLDGLTGPVRAGLRAVTRGSSRLGAWSRERGVERWLRRVLFVVVSVILCHLGGAVATSVFPGQAETDHYRAEASLDIAPWQTSRLRAFTTVGDTTIDFRSRIPAPGIEARPQVKMSLLDSVAAESSQATPQQALVPSTAEVDQAARVLVGSLAVRYLIGALVVALALIGTQGLHGRKWRLRQVATPLSAVVVAAALTGASCAYVYRPDQVASYKSTELLAAVQASPAVLTQIEERAGQVGPYITNWLTLQRALQDRFVTTETTLADSVRFLLISDVHGTNEYAVVKKIIQEENISAVIDSGDLINFGQVEEGELAQVFKGIRDLGVPYLFVDGNHDAASPTDHRLLDRMAEIPNVFLLQPNDTTYDVVSIGGVRVSGLNDPRYYGDDNDPGKVEKPAAVNFDASMQGVPDLDLAVVHEPTAAEAVTAGRLRINGHMHAAALADRRIQVGTLTGGGLMSHFRNSSQEDGELGGQPQAFDILRFNADCTVNSLQRFVFSDLIEGSPKYESISVVNGATLKAPRPSPGRSCTLEGSPLVDTVPARTVDGSTAVGPAEEQSTPD